MVAQESVVFKCSKINWSKRLILQSSFPLIINLLIYNGKGFEIGFMRPASKPKAGLQLNKKIQRSFVLFPFHHVDHSVPKNIIREREKTMGPHLFLYLCKHHHLAKKEEKRNRKPHHLLFHPLLIGRKKRCTCRALLRCWSSCKSLAN